jgi:hypothetical protein
MQAFQRANAFPRSGKPSDKVRLDPYKRLLHRFYEPLNLLEALGQTREEIDRPLDPLDGHNRQRIFLDGLSSLCDCVKGGDGTSAMGLEQNPSGICLWLATNKPSLAEANILFIRIALEDARNILLLPDGETERGIVDFTARCIQHASLRIGKEASCLRVALRLLQGHLRGRIQGPSLAQWLDRFQHQEKLQLPWFAYEHRHDGEIERLKQEMEIVSREVAISDPSDTFGRFKHCLGRLANHVRCPRTVLGQLRHLPHLHEIRDVRLIPPSRSPVSPEMDGQTTLKGILKRMLPADDPRLDKYNDSLKELDRKYAVGERVRKTYDGEAMKIVHCEVQVAEYFYHNKLIFVGNDPYVGCSKPACFCCQLYFKFHPGDFVVPRSHHKIWLKWGLPGVVPLNRDQPSHFDKTTNTSYRYQLDLLNKMAAEIRRKTLRHIETRAERPPWHPDSSTAITSVAAVRELLEEIQISQALGATPPPEVYDAATTENDDTPRGSSASSPSGSPLFETGDDSDTDDESLAGGASLVDETGSDLEKIMGTSGCDL